MPESDVIDDLIEARCVCREDRPIVITALVKAYGEILALRKNLDVIVGICAGAGIGSHGQTVVNRVMDLKAELGHQIDRADRLTAENDAVWDAIGHLETLLTAEQIHVELERRGIDMTKAKERVRAALALAQARPTP